MVDLEDKIASEFKGSDGIVEGTITVGCGEFMAVEIFARICKIYKEKYPMSVLPCIQVPQILFLK